MAEKIYIVVFLFLYFIIVFIYPTIRVKRKTGIIAYVFSNTDSLQDYIRKVLTLINFLVFFMVLVNLFDLVYQYLIPVNWLEISIIKYTGFILIHIALLWIVIAQVQMGNSWRVGIDLSTKTELKTKGLFSVSRNPVFLGMLITLTGIFLILPNAISLLVLVTTTLIFQVQVRLEEEYLVKKHGKSYVDYCKKVGRWF
ncbi:MAG: isoprenylcysteine carboxylmethyltransferase family protein [Prolixibacteraceae bacterium]|nr:isoprenylcysteine carboxylmethyltransferase family protein [Prolixibacteraceae bacterium]